MREAQAYALSNGLGLQDGMPTVMGGTDKTIGATSTSIEASREATQKHVNALKKQLETARRLEMTMSSKHRYWRRIKIYLPNYSSWRQNYR